MFLFDTDSKTVSQLEWQGRYSTRDLEAWGMEGSPFQSVLCCPELPRDSGTREKDLGVKHIPQGIPMLPAF